MAECQAQSLKDLELSRSSGLPQTITAIMGQKIKNMFMVSLNSTYSTWVLSTNRSVSLRILRACVIQGLASDNSTARVFEKQI